VNCWTEHLSHCIMLIIIHVRCDHALHAWIIYSLDMSLSRVSKGSRANNCHGPRLDLIRHWAKRRITQTTPVVSALLLGNWQDFERHDASRGPSATAELLVKRKSAPMATQRWEKDIASRAYERNGNRSEAGRKSTSAGLMPTEARGNYLPEPP